MVKNAFKKTVKYSAVKGVAGNYKRRLNPRPPRKYSGKRRNYRRKSYKKRSLKRATKWIGNDQPWKSRKVTFTERIVGEPGNLTPWAGINVGTYRKSQGADPFPPTGEYPFVFQDSVGPTPGPAVPGIRSTDLHYALQVIGYQDTDGTDTLTGNSRQKVYVKNSSISAQIRNNTNVAVNLKFYRYRPRKDSGASDNYSNFEKAWRTSVNATFGSANAVIPLNTTPYDMPTFTAFFTIEKSWRIKLLPGEKTTVYLKNKFVMGEPHTFANTMSTQRWTKYLGMVAYSDPIHSASDPSKVSTAPFQLDVVYNATVSSKQFTQPALVPFTGKNYRPVVTDPTAVAAFANEAMVIESS